MQQKQNEGFSFKNDKEINIKTEKINNDAPKTLLKSYKTSPTNQNKRENANIRSSEKDSHPNNNREDTIEKNDVPSNSNNFENEKMNRNLKKNDTIISFGNQNISSERGKIINLN